MSKTLGILAALQGAFEEHEASFRHLPEELLKFITITQVRTVQELDKCDALVIPGGESTTIKIIAGTDNFMDILRAYIHGGKGSDGVERPPRPAWGTCAGCILLSDNVTNGAGGGGGLVGKFGQESATKRCKYGEQVGGLAISTCRNFFGRQIESFEAPVTSEDPSSVADPAGRKAFSEFPAVFIRAPAILEVGAGVRVLARMKHPSTNEDAAVAAASDRVLVTCFHPELVQDYRIHQYFVEHFVLKSTSNGLIDGRATLMSAP
eukprot:CAMPEP_0177382926 /NCGR_PEP_ID=MMETSP0368-20130122/48852_1 /TAXON_ID=447022 ORGANISM="Scrippsiella hangoei-like, Strain SHHI-4" /NCGR_SAMPLE_ID=MMETSP0368 /ASSEMBLY_ACC=CAM_ASM_000363 /LENGTH=263 /DNA_ID=CAMNT_0018847423 /DNA_START=63 /DNA_END=855 /DNA_ORIENTATION=+